MLGIFGVLVLPATCTAFITYLIFKRMNKYILIIVFLLSLIPFIVDFTILRWMVTWLACVFPGIIKPGINIIPENIIFSNVLFGICMGAFLSILKRVEDAINLGNGGADHE